MPHCRRPESCGQAGGIPYWSGSPPWRASLPRAHLQPPIRLARFSRPAPLVSVCSLPFTAWRCDCQHRSTFIVTPMPPGCLGLPPRAHLRPGPSWSHHQRMRVTASPGPGTVAEPPIAVAGMRHVVRKVCLWPLAPPVDVDTPAAPFAVATIMQLLTPMATAPAHPSPPLTPPYPSPPPYTTTAGAPAQAQEHPYSHKGHQPQPLSREEGRHWEAPGGSWWKRCC